MTHVQGIGLLTGHAPVMPFSESKYNDNANSQKTPQYITEVA